MKKKNISILIVLEEKCFSPKAKKWTLTSLWKAAITAISEPSCELGKNATRQSNHNRKTNSSSSHALYNSTSSCFSSWCSLSCFVCLSCFACLRCLTCLRCFTRLSFSTFSRGRIYPYCRDQSHVTSCFVGFAKDTKYNASNVNKAACITSILYSITLLILPKRPRFGPS